MEIFEPQHFFQMADLISGVLTGAVAIAGLLIATLTYKVAAKALNIWREEKQFDLEIELKSKMGEALTLLNRLNRTSFSTSDLDDDQKWILDDLQKRFNDDQLVAIQKIQSAYHNHFFQNMENDLVRLRQTSMKALNYNKNNDIKKFYTLWSIYEGEIFNTIYNYCFIYLNYYSELYNFPPIKHNGSVMPLPRLNYLLEQGYTLEQSADLLFENLSKISKEEEYIEMLNIYRNTYFPIF